MSATRRTSSTTASTSPRSTTGSRSTQFIEPVAVRRGTLAANSSASAARKLRRVRDTQLTPGGRSARGER